MYHKIIMGIMLFFITLQQVNAQKNNDKIIEINNGIERPKLVVGLIIDQMRWDYLYRFYNRYSEGGFKRLIKKGFSFENTIIPYTPTVTAAGHACIYTGSIPAINGIVGNDWVERNTGELMYCTQDKSVKTVGSFSLQGQMSPKNMLSSTIGDELRLGSNKKSRVFGIALKDRGAILPAGHAANAAYWLDDSTGNWISSSYYMDVLPIWAQQFNMEKKPDEFIKNGWNLLNNLSSYDQSTSEDNNFEKTISGEKTSTFPHKYSSNNGKNYKSIRTSPFGNTYTFDFAKRLIENEKLGISGQTDMLCVSLSSTDYIGHTFGPQSVEVEDTYLRLDKDIASFLEMLDKRFGQSNYVLFLSADHGASYSGDFMKEEKYAGGNLSGNKMRKDLNDSIAAKYKVQNLIKFYSEYQFYIDKKKADSLKVSDKRIYDYIISYLLKKPEIMYAFSYKNFDTEIMPAVMKERFTNGFFSKRSSDIQFVMKPQYSDGDGKGTEHGVWYNYDAHIPLLFFGGKIKPGKSNKETYMTDIAPTLAAMLHIQMPSGSVGKVLEEVIR
jgi:predicted AlkP superfamily pyrophosphatase or phosphodiesterase